MKLYHYRSISSALLEIENGTFHFASKEELNDPLEGFVRVFWQGDKMAWEGLFRHYIYSVARALELYILKADDETLYHGTLVADVHCYKNNFFEKILLKLGEEFITDTDVQNLAGVYGDNCLKVSEKELQYILFYIHNNALIRCLEEFKKNKFVPAEEAEKQKKQFAGCEIMGKKLGIIGLGAIGAMVANAASALGMEVYGYDPYISIDAAWNLSRTIKHIKSLDEIYSQCDYITIHVPLLDSTKEMINKEALDKMKDGVVLLNFARDLLVDEDALIEALDSGKVKKYVTDFANHTVAGHKGILVTPHLGASTEESEENCAVMAVKEVRDFLENGNIKNSVNFPNCDMGTCVAVGRIAICHKNIPNMISQFTKILGAEGLNIADMTNKSKGEYAYTLIDLESAASREALDELKAIEGVSRVRVVK